MRAERIDIAERDFAGAGRWMAVMQQLTHISATTTHLLKPGLNKSPEFEVGPGEPRIDRRVASDSTGKAEGIVHAAMIASATGDVEPAEVGSYDNPDKMLSLTGQREQSPRASHMKFVDATASYEKWLGKHLPLVKRDLKHKHETMHADCFAFLRGTYYRWVQIWPDVCPELARAPRLLGVGDLHLANFGTWRDSDARLVWGVNDFDEASPTAYTNDLVRLATSALLAGESGQLRLSAKRATREILEGYTSGLNDKDAAPIVLEEDNEELRQIRLSDVRDPAKFWRKLRTETWGTASTVAKTVIGRALPGHMSEVTYRRRTAGVGSLGVPRYVGIGEHQGALVAREAKSRAPLAIAWAQGHKTEPAHYAAIIRRSVRAPDPFLKIDARWVVRRLAHDCSRIELDAIARSSELSTVLNAMGRETANVHRGAKVLAPIRKHLAKQKSGWLAAAAERMADATLKDWRAWRKR
jgi:uncharacterized protein (DUF2252 family)